MQFKIRICLFLLPIVLLSCKKSNHTLVDVHVDLSLKTDVGKDLLDPDNPNGFDVADIQLYSKQDGKLVPYSQGNYDYPKGFFIYTKANDNVIRIFPMDTHLGGLSKTYIKWSDSDIDTLECMVNNSNNFTRVTAVSFNNQLMWETKQQRERLIEIIKK